MSQMLLVTRGVVHVLPQAGLVHSSCHGQCMSQGRHMSFLGSPYAPCAGEEARGLGDVGALPHDPSGPDTLGGVRPHAKLRELGHRGLRVAEPVRRKGPDRPCQSGLVGQC